LKEHSKKNNKPVKVLIIFMLVLMCIVPTGLCLYTMIRMDGLEQKLNLLIERESERSENEAAMKADFDKSLKVADGLAENLDREAGSAIEKDSAEVKILSLQSGFDSDISEFVEETAATQKKKVYLTFDDGPSDYTDEILDVLKEEGVKATFFVVGADEEHFPALKRIVKEGHTLGIHSMTHEYKTIYADIESFEEDVSSMHEMLYNVTGVDVKYYRFPGGSSNKVSKVDIQDCIKYLTDNGYTYFDWNALNEDATGKNYSAKELNANALSYIRSNKGDSVVLMHDLNGLSNTRESLKSLIETLKNEGYEILPITDSTDLVQHRKLKE